QGGDGAPLAKPDVGPPQDFPVGHLARDGDEARRLAGIVKAKALPETEGLKIRVKPLRSQPQAAQFSEDGVARHLHRPGKRQASMAAHPPTVDASAADLDEAGIVKLFLGTDDPFF